MPRFVVHEHHASRLHWDFRLELNGVLRSWAVPKGPPTEAGVKRLAVAVEDHPLDYIDFSGTIEEGYGKGTVAIWDHGEFELVTSSDDIIKIRMSGNKLTGPYRLFHFTSSGNPKNWLLMKGREDVEGSAAATKTSTSSKPRSASKKKRAKAAGATKKKTTKP